MFVCEEVWVLACVCVVFVIVNEGMQYIILIISIVIIIKCSSFLILMKQYIAIITCLEITRAILKHRFRCVQVAHVVSE